MKKFLQALVLMVVLAVLAGPAMALGLGPITVKSRAGQPLLAEIAIMASDPRELQGMRAGLASPETFQRVGLQVPSGVVSDLRFELTMNERAQPVIRVTSVAPVQQPSLTFLVEVEWGGGRLVREYSALVDTPRTVAAPIAPPIQAPVVAPANTIERAPEPVAEAPAAATPLPERQPVAAVPAPVPVQPAPAPVVSPPPAPPVPAPVAPPPPAPVAAAPVARSSGQITVQRGDTLSAIAGGLTGPGMGLEQAMIALLRANPDAFIDGNINRVKAGAVLHMPVDLPGDLADGQRAAALVEEQMQRWRSERAVTLQPAAVTRAERAAPAVAASTASAITRPAAPRRDTTQQAQLRIVSARPDQQARNPGVGGGGVGDGMAEQDLQITKETLAARDAEVTELKARVAELEKLKSTQDRLLSMKDSELAAAQQRIAQREKAAPPAPATAGPSGMPLWWWLPVGLLLAALAWWLLRRGRGAPVWKPRAGKPTPAPTAPPARQEPVGFAMPSMPLERVEPVIPAVPGVPITPAPVPPVTSAPVLPPTFAPVPSPTSAPLPTFAPAPVVAPALDVIAEPLPTSAPNAVPDRLEEARRLVATGDLAGARALLNEAVANGRPLEREAAIRRLRELD